MKIQEGVSEQEIDWGFEKGKYMFEGRVWFITIKWYLKKINRFKLQNIRIMATL